MVLIFWYFKNLIKIRNTDVCKYCHNAFKLKRELIKYAAEHNFIYEDSSHFAENLLKSKYFQLDETDLNCKLMIQHFEATKFAFKLNLSPFKNFNLIIESQGSTIKLHWRI